MKSKRPIFDDEEEMYIPDIGDVDEEIEPYVEAYAAFLRDYNPEWTHVETAMKWSELEQQMFDMLLLNRFNSFDRELLDETARTISRLVETFEAHEIARITAVAMMSFQLAAAEDKSFEDEYKKYVEYIQKHPEDIEEVQNTGMR